MDGFSYLKIATVITLVLLSVFVLVLVFWIKPALEHLYLMMGLTLGILFLFLIPPFVTPDEDVHIRASYYVSNCILGIDPGDPEGDIVTMRQCDAAMEIHNHGTRDSYNYYLEKIFQGPGESGRELTAFSYKYLGNSRLWVYTVGAVGLAFARILGMGAVDTILMGSLFNVIFFVLAVYYSMKKLPFGKMVMFVTALLPMTLQQTSSLSYDNILLASLFVLTALSLHWRYGGERAKKSEVLVYLLIVAVLFGVKSGVYLLFVYLPFVLQLRREMITKKRLIICLAILSACLLVGVFALAGTIEVYWEKVQNPDLPGEYLRYADTYAYSLYDLTHPISRFLYLMWNTVVYNSRWYLQTMAVGPLGYFEIGISTWNILLYYVILLCASVRKSDETACMRMPARIFVWGMCILCSGLIILSMLLFWTPAGSSVVEGVQGRYFLPYLPLAAYTIRCDRIRREKIRDEYLALALLLPTIISCLSVLRVVGGN